MVKNGRKRNEDHSDMDIYVTNEVVCTQWSSDPQAYATDATPVLGAFTGTNFYAVNMLNREFDKQKSEIVSLKEELKHLNRQHENRCDEPQEKNVDLNEELQREKTVNANLV